MQVYAHRGASGEFPENSQIAIEQAITQQADGIELDVQYHASGQWWLLHDLYVDKTTDGTGRLLALEKSVIETLTTKANQPLVKLEQALSVINKQCDINVEVKISTGNPAQLRLAATQLIALLSEAVNNNICEWAQFSVSSFNHLFLAQMKPLMPQLNLGALIAHCPIDLAACAKKIGANSINLSLDCLNQAIVDDAHQRGLSAWVYTVDRAEDIAFCHNIGVDAIFSNFPKKAKEIIESMN